MSWTTSGLAWYTFVCGYIFNIYFNSFLHAVLILLQTKTEAQLLVFMRQTLIWQCGVVGRRSYHQGFLPERISSRKSVEVVLTVPKTTRWGGRGWSMGQKQTLPDGYETTGFVFACEGFLLCAHIRLAPATPSKCSCIHWNSHLAAPQCVQDWNKVQCVHSGNEETVAFIPLKNT